jgi:hypothetical protein
MYSGSVNNARYGLESFCVLQGEENRTRCLTAKPGMSSTSEIRLQWKNGAGTCCKTSV